MRREQEPVFAPWRVERAMNTYAALPDDSPDIEKEIGRRSVLRELARKPGPTQIEAAADYFLKALRKAPKDSFLFDADTQEALMTHVDRIQDTEREVNFLGEVITIAGKSALGAIALVRQQARTHLDIFEARAAEQIAPGLSQEINAARDNVQYNAHMRRVENELFRPKPK